MAVRFVRLIGNALPKPTYEFGSQVVRDEFPLAVVRRSRRAVRWYRRMEERNAYKAEGAEIITAQ